MNESTELSGLSGLSGTGYLCVLVSTASGAIPITDASVTVRQNAEHSVVPAESGAISQLVRHLTSDESGRTETISFPAPPRLVSLSPNAALTYVAVDITVEKEGYYRAYYQNVPIYDSITSLQPAFLIPLSERASEKPYGRDDFYYPQGMNPNLVPKEKAGQEDETV